MGLLIPRAPGCHRFAFRDLISARTVVALIAEGVSALRISQAVMALRRLNPEIREPLATCSVFAFAGRMVVALDGVMLDPIDGQLLLVDVVGPMKSVRPAHAGRVLAAEGWRAGHPWHHRRGWTADQWCQAGRSARADGVPLAEVEALYQKALRVDPDHLEGLTELGHLHYEQGSYRRAVACYRRVVRRDAMWAEGHYNLANALDALGQWPRARDAHRRALALQAHFVGAHFNLALVLEKMEDRLTAAVHWRRVIDLEPEGVEAAIAWGFLSDRGPNPRLPLVAGHRP
ncbi:MAG: tetratricopeptide repeat protein [Bradymonadia bacterium]